MYKSLELKQNKIHHSPRSSQTTQNTCLPEICTSNQLLASQNCIQMKKSNQNGSLHDKLVERFNASNELKNNTTGLPENLKQNIEAKSGLSMDDVRVHYNSSKPEQLQAYAYAQGTDIHVAPGQEKHLPHEAWHVVQQKQGRVKPTIRQSSENINDDSTLEREADNISNLSPKRNSYNRLINKKKYQLSQKSPIQCKNNKSDQRVRTRQRLIAINAARQAGAQRAQQYQGNWEVRNWRLHVNQLGRAILPNQPQYTDGKTIFNLSNGEQIVIDIGGGYWRHYDGIGQYFDRDGGLHPNLPQFHPITHFRSN